MDREDLVERLMKLLPGKNLIKLKKFIDCSEEDYHNGKDISNLVLLGYVEKKRIRKNLGHSRKLAKIINQWCDDENLEKEIVRLFVLNESFYNIFSSKIDRTTFDKARAVINNLRLKRELIYIKLGKVLELIDNEEIKRSEI